MQPKPSIDEICGNPVHEVEKHYMGASGQPCYGMICSHPH